MKYNGIKKYMSANMRLVGCNDLQAPPQRSILMRLPVALCPQCHGAQPTALGCACEGGVRGDRVREGYDPVQTA
jgi:hypothetical protein